MNTKSPYIPGTTPREIIEDMTRSFATPVTKDQVEYLVWLVVQRTCRQLKQVDLGTLTIERYILGDGEEPAE